MSSPDPKTSLRDRVQRVVREKFPEAGEFEVEIERPKNPEHGDFTTNVALQLAKRVGKKPREVAEAIRAELENAEGIAQTSVAGPGFINFTLSSDSRFSVVADVLAARQAYGRSPAHKDAKIMVEFVSANPTGPLHVGHGRQAALGDVISALLESQGWRVTREFYYNDAGNQIATLALSVQARIKQARGETVEMPKDGYLGDYILEIAREYVAAHFGDATGNKLEQIRTFSVEYLRREQDLDLHAFGVKFDSYFLESSLYTDGSVDESVRLLGAAGHTYESAGALWLKTTDFGDDKDRVMRKSDGTYTYFVPDVAYHLTKFRRGFARVVNVQGADHHSTVTRVRAGLQALETGIPRGYPDYVLHQMVTVMKGGEEMKISKRAGSYVTVRDLIDEVGRDAVRYFFLMRKGDSQLVFDIDLARSQSEENPVYYIQMAHARLCGIFRVGEIDATTVTADGVHWECLAEPEERELIKALLDWPRLLQGAAESLEPHRVANYLLETARMVHTWYHKHHVLNEPEHVMRARLVLAKAARIVLVNGLDTLGISAPERM